MRISMSATLTLLAAALAAACGGEGSYSPDPSVLPEDTPRPLTYPAGPYGTSVGSVMENTAFASAMYDPAFLCKNAGEQRLADGKGPRGLTMGDLYRGSGWCNNKPVQLAWIAVTAGW